MGDDPRDKPRFLYLTRPAEHELAGSADRPGIESSSLCLIDRISIADRALGACASS